MRADIQDHVAGGFLPLRHEDKSVDVSCRIVRYACRPGGTDDSGAGHAYDELGQLRGETELNGRENTYGDILGFGLWQSAGGTQGREIPGWSSAWAAQVFSSPSRDEDVIKGDVTSRVGSFNSTILLPTYDEDYAYDTRFIKKQAKFPDYFGKLADRVSGVMLTGTNEYSQEDLFIPCSPMIAVNAADSSDPEVGSRVYDTTNENALDQGRWARLQSMMRVIKMQDDIPKVAASSGSLAWQLTSSKRDNLDGFGLMYGKGAPALGGLETDDNGDMGLVGSADRSSALQYSIPQLSTDLGPPRVNPGATYPISETPVHAYHANNTNAGKRGDPPASVAAPTSQEKIPDVMAYAARHDKYGPFDLGSPDDQHQHQIVPDGPINSAHISTDAYFRGQGGDAPLNFENVEWADPGEKPFRARGHIRMDTAEKHDFTLGERDGKWKIITEYDTYHDTPVTTETPPVREPPVVKDVIIDNPPHEDPPPPEPSGPVGTNIIKFSSLTNLPPVSAALDPHFSSMLVEKLPVYSAILPGGVPTNSYGAAPLTEASLHGAYSTASSTHVEQQTSSSVLGSFSGGDMNSPVPVIQLPLSGPPVGLGGWSGGRSVSQERTLAQQSVVPNGGPFDSVIVSTPLEHAFGSLLMRAHPPSLPDARSPSSQISSTLHATFQRQAPLVCRLEAYGNFSGGRTAFSRFPGSGGRNVCGTSQGGLVFAPPDHGAENILAVRDPSTSGLSPNFTMWGSNLAFGTPTTSGGIKSGVSHASPRVVHNDNSVTYNVSPVRTDGTVDVSNALISMRTHAEGTNVLASGNSFVTAPLSTGNQSGGIFIIQAGKPGASGTSQNAVFNAVTVSGSAFQVISQNGLQFPLVINLATSTVRIGSLVDGTTINFFGALSPVGQQTVTATTDLTGGTPSDSFVNSGAAYSQANQNNFRASVALQLEGLRTALTAYGLLV